jgi:hypothetical protein
MAALWSRSKEQPHYAASKDKTVTQIIEDWIDRLPNAEIDKNSTAPLPVKP